ncbi:hypothetical protein Ddye_008800 [Dipteronia dyeriana]|uniref:Uncharacterized protein n=1 Tax=Dipteronia dyeriana TaxID=168575 RepID=A0AAD9XB30_9ROSI|nr:hypothetical protein Ddye_008800 [Dipteronia dyeriana]
MKESTADMACFSNTQSHQWYLEKAILACSLNLLPNGDKRRGLRLNTNSKTYYNPNSIASVNSLPPLECWIHFIEQQSHCFVIARMLTVRRERELEEGINKRLSRKLDRQWKKSIVVRPPPSLKKLQEEQAVAEAEKSS